MIRKLKRKINCKWRGIHRYRMSDYKCTVCGKDMYKYNERPVTIVIDE